MADHSPRVRLFFALLPGAVARERVTAAADAVAQTSLARRVMPHEFHVTLAFIGNIAAERLPRGVAIGRERVASPVILRFDGYDYWGRAEAVVLTAGIVSAALLYLHQELRAGLASERWAPLDPFSFRPHITVLRKVVQQPVLPQLQPIEWTARSFT